MAYSRGRMNNNVISFLVFLITIALNDSGNARTAVIDSFRSEKQDTLVQAQSVDSAAVSDSVDASLEASLGLEIDGLVVDETQTKIGRDFYDIFYSNWEAPAKARDYTIIIVEKPLPRLGTQISIEINDTEVFRQFLQPRYAAIEEMALYGVQAAREFLANYAEIKKQLEGEDLQGTGIY